MSFKVTLEVDVDQNPDAVGEALRSAFFDEKMVKPRHGLSYRETGCYSTFEWQPDVEPLPSLLIETEHTHPEGEEADDLCWACDSTAKWTRGRKKFQNETIECRWYWDGDGTLAFSLPDGRWLMNDDCKKSYGWEILDREELLNY